MILQKNTRSQSAGDFYLVARRGIISCSIVGARGVPKFTIRPEMFKKVFPNK